MHFIFIKSTLHSPHLQLLPDPSFLPQTPPNFISIYVGIYNLRDPISVLHTHTHTHTHTAVHCSVSNLAEVPPLYLFCLPLQLWLSIASQWGVGAWGPPTSILDYWLDWSRAGNHGSSVQMTAMSGRPCFTAVFLHFWFLPSSLPHLLWCSESYGEGCNLAPYSETPLFSALWSSVILSLIRGESWTKLCRWG